MADESGVDVVLFSDEVKKGADFLEVLCCCTSRRYNNAVGRLWVFASDDLEINCVCTPCGDEAACIFAPEVLYGLNGVVEYLLYMDGMDVRYAKKGTNWWLSLLRLLLNPPSPSENKVISTLSLENVGDPLMYTTL